MGPFLEVVYDVLFHPFGTMPRIADEKPLGQAVAAFFISVCIPAVAAFFAVKTGNWQKILVAAIAMQVFASFCLWFCSAAVWGLLAELFGGHGTVLGLFVAMGFTHIPRILVVPFFVLAAVLPSGPVVALLFIATVLIMVWTLTLDVAAIKGAYGLSGAKAVAVLATPLVILGVAVVILLAYVGTMLWPGRL